MRLCRLALGACLALILSMVSASARSPILLPQDPSLSPDGKTLAFSWRGDLWTVSSGGGVARPLTQHPGRDTHPVFSPDGSQIAFLSDRQPGPQVFLMPATGGTPRQITSHSEGYTLVGWYPDSAALIASAARDFHYHSRLNERLFRIPLDPPAGEQLLFDDYGGNASVSPDGQRILFTREGEEWWRKGYQGSRASQIWMFQRETGEFTQLIAASTSARWPLWRPDGKGFYCVRALGGSFNLWDFDLATGQSKALTHLEDDSVVFPCISRDGGTLVFRHLFHFYRYHPAMTESPVQLEIFEEADPTAPQIERRALARATDVSFSQDGLEVAFIAGGDLWVMDTDLREPRQITNTPEEERDPAFAPDGLSILFTSDQGGQNDVWRAQPAKADLFWWQNQTFKLERLTQDGDIERNLQWNPDGTRVAFIKGGGDLWTLDPGKGQAQCIHKSWSEPDYEWSPDGQWFVASLQDQDFNRDIWVFPSDGTGSPVNISKHPDNESNPTWSHDGRLIAFTGRRLDTEVDIFYVWLRAEDQSRSKRDRTLDKALEKMTKVRKKEKGRDEKKSTADAPSAASSTNAAPNSRTPASKPDEPTASEPSKEKPTEKTRKTPEVRIDPDDIHDRLRQISIPNSVEQNLVWSHDSKKLAFTATVDGKRGTYTVEIPDDVKPKLLSTETGTRGRWIDSGNQIVWLSGAGSGPASQEDPPTQGPGGVPGSLTDSGKSTNFTFRIHQAVDPGAKYRAAFDLAWRTMRDEWYDEHLGNRNWDQIRRKYSDAAASAPDPDALSLVINLMLGELNGSHLGFSTRRSETPNRGNDWVPVTVHLGVRWDPSHPGPGLKIRDVLPNGPADHKTNGLSEGEVVLAIDGTQVDPRMDLAPILNGLVDRDVRLQVRNAAGQEREVTLRPITYAAARPLLYEQWIDENRARVERLSEGTMGYLHISGMNWPSFQKFERDLYAAGAGKDGLVIDVRENGGGSTADHLLTALTQPRHAVTVPRGGIPGYPQDRMVYATWNKPIVVLCNQNSFSNAEIFSHAIKTLHRGQLVGTPTAGGVISTGSRPIMDLGFLRLPFRGWFVLGTGEDMELNGAVPDYVIWPKPGELPQGKDAQLAKAVEVLRQEIQASKQNLKPSLRKATDRPPKKS